MTKPRRIFALFCVPLAMAILWLNYTGGAAEKAEAQQQGGGDAQVNAKLQEAADSIIAAAKLGVHSARSDEEIVNRIDLSIEALRVLGLLGDIDANLKIAQLLDDVQAGASPPVAEAIIQMRVARHLRQWSRLDATTRKAAIDRFVEDINQTGLTPPHVDLLSRITGILEQTGETKLAADAISKLLPAFQTSPEPSIQRRAPIMAGVVRRLNLVGQPLELEGTLLDGQQFDWSAYRGKVVLVDFFANWCEICRQEVPNILQYYRAYHDKGFEVVGVSLDDQPRLAEMYRKQTGFQFPTIISTDPKASSWNSPLAVKYGITGLPQAILVDENGNVVETLARGPRLGQQLQALLGPPNAPVGGRVGQLDSAPDSELIEDSSVVPASFEEVSEAPSEGETAAPQVPE